MVGIVRVVVLVVDVVVVGVLFVVVRVTVRLGLGDDWERVHVTVPEGILPPNIIVGDDDGPLIGSWLFPISPPKCCRNNSIGSDGVPPLLPLLLLLKT